MALLDSNTTIRQALKFAQNAHRGQVDKAGEPYYKHLIRVSARCKTPLAQTVGLLHDTLEDTSITYDILVLRFGQTVADLVEILTRLPDEPYFDYIGRCADNPIAREVKIADLIDNSNLTRLPIVTSKDISRQYKYNRALYILTAIHEIS